MLSPALHHTGLHLGLPIKTSFRPHNISHLNENIWRRVGVTISLSERLPDTGSYSCTVCLFEAHAETAEPKRRDQTLGIRRSEKEASPNDVHANRTDPRRKRGTEPQSGAETRVPVHTEEQNCSLTRSANVTLTTPREKKQAVSGVVTS